MNFFLPIHLDGGNRGCEAITKGTAIILGIPKENLIALSQDPQLDTRLGVNKTATLVPTSKVTLWHRIQRKLISIISKDMQKVSDFTYPHLYDSFLQRLTKTDIMLSTGGDMMCYGNNQVIYTNNWLHSRNIKTILWGCSIGESNLTPEKIATLHNFSMIYARESLTAETLKKLGLKNVITYPDPAFILKPEHCELPPIFEKEVIGINLSNYVIGSDNLDTPFGKEAISLIEHILQKTDLNILLVPHVLWKGQDDRLISNSVMEYFKFNPRIHILDSESLNYCQIRYAISHCKYFIGARTHAVISAYSTCVPTIALGYSIKSKGIAKDLQLPEELVVDSKDFKQGTLLNSFIFLQENEHAIRNSLNDIIPGYVKQLDDVKNKIYGKI